MGEYAFEGNKLTSVTIVNPNITMGYGAFYGSPNLTTVTLPPTLYNTLLAGAGTDASPSLTSIFGIYVTIYEDHSGNRLN